jgi:hypothetical protein
MEMNDYNEQRPHDALDGMTPTAFSKKFEQNSILHLSS